MLDSIGYIDVCPFNTSLSQRLVEQLACRSNKRMPGQVFLISGLLTHEDDGCVRRPFSKYGLSGVFPKVAVPAPPSSLPEFVDRTRYRKYAGKADDSRRFLPRTLRSASHVPRLCSIWQFEPP
jgi:hypothetical protein